MTVSFSFLLFHSITSPHPTTLDVPSLDDVRLDIPHCVYAYPQLTHPLHQREHAIDDVLEGYQEEGVEVSQVVEGAVLVCEVRIDGRQGGLAVAGEGHDGSQVGEEGAGGVGGGGGWVSEERRLEMEMQDQWLRDMEAERRANLRWRVQGEWG